MRTIYIYAGTHKTGSSSIQHFLSSQKTNRFYYLDKECGSISHNYIVQNFVQDPFSLQLKLQEFERNYAENIPFVICAESFYCMSYFFLEYKNRLGLLVNEEYLIRKLADTLSHYNVEVYISTQEELQYWNNIWKELVKEDLVTEDFDNWQTSISEIINIRTDIIAIWKQYFKLKIMEYSKDGDHLKEFLKLFGVEQAKLPRKNTSLCMCLTEDLRYINMEALQISTSKIYLKAWTAENLWAKYWQQKLLPSNQHSKLVCATNANACETRNLSQRLTLKRKVFIRSIFYYLENHFVSNTLVWDALRRIYRKKYRPQEF